MKKVKWARRMARKPAKISKNLSYNELESYLSSDKIDIKMKEQIITWLHEKQVEMDEEWENQENGKKSFFDFFTDSIPLRRLAKYHLFREGHPSFSMRGTGARERLICSDEYSLNPPPIISTMQKLTNKWNDVKARVQKINPKAETIEEMADALNQDKD